MADDKDPLLGKESEGKSEGKWKLIAAIVAVILLVIAIVVCVVVSMEVRSTLLDMARKDFLYVQYKWTIEYAHSGLNPTNLSRNSWYPGCGYTAKSIGDGDDLSCLEPCISPKLFLNMEKSFKDDPAELVSYSSRDEEHIELLTLRGWLFTLNGTSSTSAPRIVVQHGFTANAETFRTQAWAYLFRSMGFNVLLNNLRDHGHSDNSTDQIVGWGHSYPYDVLGAWDYMVKDPDNKMGGPIDPSQVGIVGYSKGAFLTSIAFGMEPQVPAVFVDSGPPTPEKAFAFPAQQKCEGFKLGPLCGPLMKSTWESLDAEAKSMGVDLEENIPADVLPKAPDTKRPVYWWHNKDDKTVSYEDGLTLLSIYEKYPEKYTVTQKHSSGDCNGENHCVDLLRVFDEMSTEVCKFFAGAMDVEPAGCSK